jgi:hypothetical protein
MTPEEYLAAVGRLARKRDSAGIIAFAHAHLSDKMLGEMTPHQRRLAWSATHVAADVLGIGAEGPGGIPVDDFIDAAS